MAKEPKYKNIEIKNRKAEFEYLFVATYEAGILLTGTEVKSIREGQANLNDAYCQFKDGELFVRNMHISEYNSGTYNNHDPRRTRKLLLNKTELRKLERRVQEKGFTIVPFRIYLSDRGLIKLEVVLAQGKKSYDKRQSIRERDNKRDLDRLKKQYK